MWWNGVRVGGMTELRATNRALIVLGIVAATIGIPVAAFHCGARWTLRNRWYDFTRLVDTGQSAAREYVAARGEWRRLTLAEYEVELGALMKSRGYSDADIEGEVNELRRATADSSLRRGRFGVFEQGGEYYWDVNIGTRQGPPGAFAIPLFPEYYTSWYSRRVPYPRAP